MIIDSIEFCTACHVEGRGFARRSRHFQSMTYCHRRAPGGYRKYLTTLANEQRAIVDAVNALRRRYTYVFTSWLARVSASKLATTDWLARDLRGGRYLRRVRQLLSRGRAPRGGDRFGPA